jgi:hypothetical protein
MSVHVEKIQERSEGLCQAVNRVTSTWTDIDTTGKSKCERRR